MKLFKNIFCLFAFILLCTDIYSQTLQRGRELFSAGKYEQALPIMRKFLAQQPDNAARNFWYGVCLYETGQKDKCLNYLQKAANKRIIKAFRYMGMYYSDIYDYPNAVDCYKEFVNGMKADKALHNDSLEQAYTYKADSLLKVYKMFRNTHKICFVDSFAVAKDNFLQTYMLDASAGRIDTYSSFFGTDIDGDVFLPETETCVYFSRKSNVSGHYNLNKAFKNGGSWTDADPLEISPNNDTRYPFVMSDGVTIYYAGKGPESIGGYDIFVTRFNQSTGNYLLPENIGMPFNSGANDYMYVVDEINNLGWFATDRNQPSDSVCIYVFVPETTRNTYDIESDSLPLIARASRIASIAESQNDPKTVEAAKQRLMLLAYSKLHTKTRSDFSFIIDDFTEYHQASDFHCKEAGDLFNEWLDMRDNLHDDIRKLELQRSKWTESNLRERGSMRAGLLELEKNTEALERSIMAMELRIRKMEIDYLSR